MGCGNSDKDPQPDVQQQPINEDLLARPKHLREQQQKTEVLASQDLVEIQLPPKPKPDPKYKLYFPDEPQLINIMKAFDAFRGENATLQLQQVFELLCVAAEDLNEERVFELFAKLGYTDESVFDFEITIRLLIAINLSVKSTSSSEVQKIRLMLFPFADRCFKKLATAGQVAQLVRTLGGAHENLDSLIGDLIMRELKTDAVSIENWPNLAGLLFEVLEMQF